MGMSVNADVARLSIVFVGLALGTLEWFIIRRTSFNKWVVPAVYCVGALVWAFAVEPAQVLFLSLVIAFIMAVYAIKDELINGRLQRRGTSGVDKTRLRDL